jgi:hypothetical protein
METKIGYKDAFGVIGKMGQGPAENAAEWIAPIWDAAIPLFWRKIFLRR